MSSWPSLTESWAAVYFEVTAGILIFGVGLPSLVLQGIVHEDVRRIVYRHRKWLRLGIFFIFVFAFIALSFVWIFHPAAQDQSNRYISTGLINTLSAGIMTVVILSLVPFSYWLGSYRRDRLLNYLGKKCKNRIRRAGSPDEAMLADLRYLGEQGEAGLEKDHALKILEQLANEIQKRIAYSGNGLESIVQAIEATLYSGDVKNFLYATQILQKLIIRLQQKNLADAPDMGAILRVLQRVGGMALELDSELAALAIRDIVSLVGQKTDGAFQLSNAILFELGVKSLEKKRFLFAVAILSRLETMIMIDSPLKPEKAVNYFGLLAHFWYAGVAVKERARLSLKKLQGQAEIRECLQTAKKHHAAQTQFDTVDKLDALHVAISKNFSKFNSSNRKPKRPRARAESSW